MCNAALFLFHCIEFAKRFEMPDLETPQTLPDLNVNDGQLDPESTGLLRATCPHDTPLNEMRDRLAQDGYLLLKGLLPREDVLKARQKYFEMLSPTGILKPGTRSVEASSIHHAMPRTSQDSEPVGKELVMPNRISSWISP